ncbi:MAG: glucose 1-dehydrogenase [Deltaproteobacteria bacterium]|nr:glucose 1-dehydrogenase [Deltaproteobacteria bacterium]
MGAAAPDGPPGRIAGWSPLPTGEFLRRLRRGEAPKGSEMAGVRELFDLSGRVALVTGGSGGLGRVFCESLAEAGADVCLTWQSDAEGAEETAARVRRCGRRALAVRGDVSDPADVERVVAETTAAFGRIDVLVNNAGINVQPAKIADMPIEDWDRVLGVNLRGVFLCTRAVLPAMVKQARGNIINIASVLGLRPFLEIGEVMPNFPYGVAKAGVIRLTKELAAQYSLQGIRANCIAPGWHRGTRLSAGWRQTAWGEEERRKYEEGIVRITAMGRRGEQEELKGLLVYLASDASSYMTGQVLVSDGGICL